MNRVEFMTALEKLLVSISEDERQEALQYYENYFEDAGPENEEQVIKELGSPEKVAAIIWADTRGGSEKNGEFTETGYTDVRFEEKAHPACREEQDTAQEKEETQETKSADTAKEHAYSYHETSRAAAGQGTESNSANQNTWQRDENGYGTGSRGYAQGSSRQSESRPGQKSENKTLKVIIIILLVIAALKVFGWLVPVAVSVIGGIIGVIIGVLGLLIGIAAAGGGLAVSGVMIVIMGITRLAASFASAILVMGIGLLMTGIGVMLAIVAIKLSLVVYPAIFRAVVNFVSGLFRRKEANHR